MELSDKVLCDNHDYNPGYLALLFSEVLMISVKCGIRMFLMVNVFSVKEVNKVEAYKPIVEDISLDDDILCQAVEQIESELVQLYIF